MAGRGATYNTILAYFGRFTSFLEREERERERVDPKKKSGKSTAAPAVTTSPRRTRSATAGKRVVPLPAQAQAPVPAKRPSKRQKVAKEEKKAEDVALPAAADGSSEAIIIEACKQCNSFKTRANIVKEGLESAVPGIDVTINPERPRRGCFEIRKAGGEVFISLLDMKRPFTPMKNLDMDKVVEDIVKKFK